MQCGVFSLSVSLVLKCVTDVDIYVCLLYVLRGNNDEWTYIFDVVETEYWFWSRDQKVWGSLILRPGSMPTDTWVIFKMSPKAHKEFVKQFTRMGIYTLFLYTFFLHTSCTFRFGFRSS